MDQQISESEKSDSPNHRITDLTKESASFKLEGEDLVTGKKRKHHSKILGISLSGDGATVSHVAAGGMSFAEFISEVPISTTLLVIGLITLVLAILDFSQALSY